MLLITLGHQFARKHVPVYSRTPRSHSAFPQALPTAAGPPRVRRCSVAAAARGEGTDDSPDRSFRQQQRQQRRAGSNFTAKGEDALLDGVPGLFPLPKGPPSTEREQEAMNQIVQVCTQVKGEFALCCQEYFMSLHAFAWIYLYSQQLCAAPDGPVLELSHILCTQQQAVRLTSATHVQAQVWNVSE